MRKPDDLRLTKHDFEVLADFRYQIRKFVRFSEQIARQHGITPRQYLLLLHVKGFPGRDWATIGELAERLQAKLPGSPENTDMTSVSLSRSPVCR